MSMRRVDVSTLVLADLNMAACLFVGSHHLDQLHIEGSRSFSVTPGAWRLRLGRLRIPVWRRWTRRQVLAEERSLRGEQHSNVASSGTRLVEPPWNPPSCEVPDWVAERTGAAVQTLSAEHLSSLYRALRKAQEDAKDEPGAADFYYGEMEMRRKAASTPLAERAVLWLYWLVSGYALRASRALVTLMILIGLVTALFTLWGLPARATSSITATISGTPPAQTGTFTLPNSVTASPPTSSLTSRFSDPKRLERAVRGALSAVVFRDIGQQLTVVGRYTEMAARFLGPVLLGLALLSVRNRVKR
jgi:hypothetical protein